ncbi:MAG: phospho-N-acetylmuramoyl-pentapeptide-transferase [Planctomycetota bacterium]
MIVNWLLQFSDQIRILNLFGYVTVRCAMAAAAAFIICLITGPSMIRRLRIWGLGEQVAKGDSQVLDKLHASKQNTPTMGGVLFISSTLWSVVLFGRLEVPLLLLGCAVLVACAGVGFLDDWLKMRRRKGLKGRSKMILLSLVAVLSSSTMMMFEARDGVSYGQLHFPFFKSLTLDLKWAYPALAILVFVGAANAVNLTDGLDGLAIGSFIPTAGAFAVMSYLAGHYRLSHYLFIPYIGGAGELAVLCSALVGAGLGFLWFNCHPAEIFMGDTGSLALGGILGFVALALHQEILLLLAGAVFAVEALSVMMQVGSYKTRGKRIFQCAPLHHHYQFMGLKESKITVRFWIMGILMAVLALLTLKIR